MANGQSSSIGQVGKASMPPDILPERSGQHGDRPMLSSGN
jgi:hypothetical protein